MAKKNQKPKKIVEEVEPFEPPAKSVESSLPEEQENAVSAESNLQDSEDSVENSSVTVEASIETSDSAGDQDRTEMATSDPPVAEEEFSEDLLADVRQSLIEEESLEKEKPQKWWRKVGKGRKKDKATKPASDEEINLPAIEVPIGAIDEREKPNESENYMEQLDELINLLEPTTEDTSPVSMVEEAPVPPEPVEPVQMVDIAELKRQAFQPRATEDEPASISDVRTVALEGEEEVFVEVESKKEDPLEERLKAFENAIQPYRRYINLAFVFLGVVMAVIAGLLLFNIYQQVTPTPIPAAVSNLPYPTSVSLPGGWSFNLGKGALQDGKWNPQGAEWLEGTEVCRWVALPWSRQLEAVIRTLNPNDPIELRMSNNDKLVYEVYSVRQLTSEEMLDLDSNSPCLLLVLAEADSDSRWVLTALP